MDNARCQGVLTLIWTSETCVDVWNGVDDDVWKGYEVDPLTQEEVDPRSGVPVGKLGGK